MKWNEELVKEKIEEYLEIYNLQGGESQSRRIQRKKDQNPILDDEDEEKRKKKHSRRMKRLTKEEEEEENAKEELKKLGIDDIDDDEDNEDGNNDDDDDDDDNDNGQNEEGNPDEDEEDLIKKRKTKKFFYGKKRKIVAEEIIPDPSTLNPIPTGTPLEPLTKQKRQPAQEKAFKELSSINERIASLVQVRQMGLATSDNTKQLKQLMKDRKKKAFELRRLQSKVKASNKYRMNRRKIVCGICSYA